MFGWFRSPDAEYQPVRTIHNNSSSSSAKTDERKSLQYTSIVANNNSDDDDSAPSFFTAQMDKIKGFVGLSEPPKEKTYAEEFDAMVSLTRTQRMYGFGITFVFGWIVSLLSLISLPQIATHPEKFALMYTVGNIISLASTAFLWGPCKQLKDMFKPIRIVATIVYLVSMGLTLFCAFGLKMMLPTVASIIVQFCAMVWYCVSYIPYGQEMLQSCVGGCCGSLLG